jgi:hypothetical protein
MITERRQAPRHPTQLKASLNIPDQSAALDVMLEDLCVLGCLLEYAPSLQVHQECKLTMEWKDREFRTPATVAWKNPQGQAGLAFHDGDPANKVLLREICSELRLRPPTRLIQPGLRTDPRT